MTKTLFSLSIVLALNASASVTTTVRDGVSGVSISGQTAKNVYSAFKIKKMEYSNHTMGNFFEANSIQCREVKSCVNNVPGETYICSVSGNQNSYSPEEGKKSQESISKPKAVQFEFSGEDAKVLFDSLVPYYYESKFNRETREVVTTTNAGNTFAEETFPEELDGSNAANNSISYDLFLTVDTSSQVRGIPMSYPCGSRLW